MQKTVVLAAVLLLSAAGSARAQTAPKTEDEKTIYALGLAIGKSLGAFNLTKPELELVKKGLTDSVTGAKPAVDLEAYGPKFDALAKTRTEKISKEYLAKAEKEKGAVKTPSGMIYTELKAGTGAQPKPTEMVKVHYKGTLVNGTEFDSSYKRGQPTEFPLNGVIPCWTEGVGKMKVGGKAKLVCPANIAYGDRGHPPTIPGGATLIFEVELLEVKAAPPPQAPPPGHPSMGGGQNPFQKK
ncbi:MAG: FKBP-type peptidyl-prolyl cis-trans isomerase [Myxococcaceae bacterium]